MALPGVVGVGESATDDGRPCLLVMVAAPPAPPLPPHLDGHPVVVEIVGDIRPR